MKKILSYFDEAICHISAQEIFMVTATVLSYVLYGSIMQSLYLWLIILACDVSIIGAHGEYALSMSPHENHRKGPWSIPTPLILRWVSFFMLLIADYTQSITLSAYGWYVMTFTAVSHAFYCILLAMHKRNSTWLEGTGGEIGLPNWISISRMSLAVIVPHLYAVQPFGPISCTLATIILLLAITTDAADGFIARKLNQCTKAGKALDPLGDKVIFYPTAIAFILATHGTAYLNGVALITLFYVCFAIMVTRDVLYIIWFFLYYKKLPEGMSASMVDKVRMATLCAWLGVSALALTIPALHQRMAYAGIVFLVIIAILSVASFFVDYGRMRTELAKLTPPSKDNDESDIV
jgi:phosphatidylglycerophosphate synthase